MARRGTSTLGQSTLGLGVVAALVLASLGAFGLGTVACGKERLGESDRGPFPRWDPPTAEHGFEAVVSISCTPFDAGPAAVRVTTATEETVEDVATVSRPLHGLAADALHVYWAEGSPPGSAAEDAQGGIFAATRPDSRGPWIRHQLAAAEEPLDLAAANGRVFWTDARGGVRLYDDATRAVDTVAVETMRPGRLVVSPEGDRVFWIAPPNHLREAHAEPRANMPGGGLLEPATPTLPQAPEWKVKNLLTLTLASNLLAVDREAAYVFTHDGALVKVGRDGATPYVLASPGGTPPVDVAAHGGWVYWLDKGPDVARCRTGGTSACGGYHNPMSHPAGVLHRVRTSGGSVEIVAQGLPEVQNLAFLGEVAWITTSEGPLRLPLGARPLSHVTRQPIPAAPVRYASIGDALVLAGGWSPSRILLLSPP